MEINTLSPLLCSFRGVLLLFAAEEKQTLKKL